MVTMSSNEKPANKNSQSSCGPSRENSKRSERGVEKKDIIQIANLPPNVRALMCIVPAPDESPNYLVYKKMEGLVEKMQDEVTGVPVRTVKSFMSKIPSVFTGCDLVAWITRHLHLEDVGEAQHMAHLLASHGYLFPVDDHILTVKNDNTYYRFQTPYFWPSNQWDPENSDYAVYLCKRTMQNKARLELADYEAEALARLQKLLSRKWEFIFMQAEAQSKVDKKRDKLERKVLDSQERAFWDLHRPMPGNVNTTEIDPRKAGRLAALRTARLRSATFDVLAHAARNNPILTVTDEGDGNGNNGKDDLPIITVECPDGPSPPALSPTITDLSPTNSTELERARRQVSLLRQRLERANVKVAKVAEMCICYYEQYAEYDPFLTPPDGPNPWISDTTELWDQEKQCKEPLSLRRVRRWSFGLRELLRDPAGVAHFTKFLEKEFSAENLRFWLSVQELKCLPLSEVKARAREIWREYLAQDAPSSLNVDAASREATRLKIESGSADRYCFDHAQAHVYHLMKSDSYSRYLRSELYRETLAQAKKKTSVKGIRSIVSFSARKEQAAAS